MAGLTGIHLQCHIGTDTLSLARLGARMTGLDLSPVSLEQARTLAADAGADIDYVEADTYSAPQALGGRTFDLVYTGIGALCWLPDIDRWAGVVDDLLEPGGRLFVREGHPMMWAVDETRTDADPDETAARIEAMFARELELARTTTTTPRKAAAKAKPAAAATPRAGRRSPRR